MRWEFGQNLARENVAAFGALVAENAVVEQIVGGVVVHAEKRRPFAKAAQRRAGFGEPDVGSEMVEADFGVDAALVVKDGIAELVEAKTAAAFPACGLGDAALLAVYDFFQSRGAVGHRVVAHFDADVAASHLVGDGCGGAGAEKAVEDNFAGV